MSNATDTDYFGAVRDASVDLSYALAEMLNLSDERADEIDALLRRFAHTVLDAAKAERSA